MDGLVLGLEGKHEGAAPSGGGLEAADGPRPVLWLKSTRGSLSLDGNALEKLLRVVWCIFQPDTSEIERAMTRSCRAMGSLIPWPGRLLQAMALERFDCTAACRAVPVGGRRGCRRCRRRRRACASHTLSQRSQVSTAAPVSLDPVEQACTLTMSSDRRAFKLKLLLASAFCLASLASSPPPPC